MQFDKLEAERFDLSKDAEHRGVIFKQAAAHRLGLQYRRCNEVVNAEIDDPVQYGRAASVAGEVETPGPAIRIAIADRLITIVTPGQAISVSLRLGVVRSVRGRVLRSAQ